MKGLVKARDDIISQLKATQEELLEFEHVNIQLKEILAQRDKEFNVVMQKNKYTFLLIIYLQFLKVVYFLFEYLQSRKLQLQLQAVQDESLKSKQTNSELSVLQDQLEDTLLHMKILNENNALQEKEINRLLIIEAEKTVGTTDQQRKENFLKV